LSFMFLRTDAMRIVTRVPHLCDIFRKACHAYGRALGFGKEFERKACWPTMDGRMVDMDFLAIEYEAWVRKLSGLEKAGHDFHEWLSEEFKARDLAEIPHPDDPSHDVRVGACSEMIRGGQYEKAVILYNRWARFAGYQPISLVSANPIIIDIGSA